MPIRHIVLVKNLCNLSIIKANKCFFYQYFVSFIRKEKYTTVRWILHQLSNVAVLPGQYSIHTIFDPWVTLILSWGLMFILKLLILFSIPFPFAPLTILHSFFLYLSYLPPPFTKEYRNVVFHPWPKTIFKRYRKYLGERIFSTKS